MEALKLPAEEIEAFKNSNEFLHAIIFSPELQKEFSGGVKLYMAKELQLWQSRYSGNHDKNRAPNLAPLGYVYMLVDKGNNVQALDRGASALTCGSEKREYREFFRLATPAPLKEKLYFDKDLKFAEGSGVGVDLETGKAIAREEIDDYNRTLKNCTDIVGQIRQKRNELNRLEANKKALDAKRKEFKKGKSPVADFIK